jgi:BatD DUF11 like domain
MNTLNLNLMRKFLFIYLFFTLSPAFAAPQLQATLEEHEINQGETVNLQITLSQAESDNAQPTAEPDSTPLQGDFAILSSQKSTASRYVNGKASSQITWTYLLEPQKTGQLSLPALSLSTTTGVLQTQPQTLIVNQGSQTHGTSPKLEATVSNPHPHLYEPVYYTLRFYHYGNLSDLQAIPPTNNVILEPLSDLTTHQQLQIDGKTTIVTEVIYLLTPTNLGKWELDASKIKGLKADKRSKTSNNFFDFSTNFRPFTTTSNSLSLDVQAPAQQPWLPAKNVTLIQHWETAVDKAVSVGVPLVRTLVLTAEGVGAQPLPKLEDVITSNDEFRVRSPKPEIERKFQADHKTPVSTVTQTFSLIPLKAGVIQLPTIRISWWDTEKQLVRWAELPAQTLQVIDNPNIITAPAPATPQTQSVTQVQIVTEMVRFDVVQYGLLGLSLGALGIAWWRVRREKMPFIKHKIQVTTTLSFAEFKRQMQATEQAKEMQHLIQTVVQQQWGLPRQIALHNLAQDIQTQDAELANLLKKLEAALYGKQQFDLADKQQIISRLPLVKPLQFVAEQIPIALSPLNPV